MPDLSEADLKFVLSVDPDMESYNQAVNELNAEVDRAKVKKIKMQLTQEMLGPPEALPVSWLEKKFGKVGSVVDSLIGKSRFGEVYKGLTGGGKKNDSGSSGIMGAIIGGAEGGGAGAAAGAAVGGNLMIAYEAIKKSAGALGELGAAPFKIINSGLSGISTALQGMQGPLGPIGASLDVLSAGLGGLSDGVKKIPVVGELFGPLLDAFAAVPGLIKAITSAIVGMVAKASPAVFEHFNHALEDAQATIGEAFIPLVETMTGVIEQMSDVIANIMEVMKPVIKDFSEIFKELGNLFKELAPLIELLVVPLKILSTVLLGLAKALTFIAKAIMSLPKAILRMAGLGGSDDDSGGKTRTTAARHPTLGGIQEYQQKLQLQTAAGPAGGMDVPTNVSNIANKVGSIDSSLQRIDKNLSKDEVSHEDVREGIARAEAMFGKERVAAWANTGR